ncbi:hypothetical protein GCM10007874_28280 [Labrys miyagiensis]|uniref:Uncharacterized protein n=1 Tax=Labrys miyagiensis TaxID=346912 RepID=A0ABQ6CHI3_9HYPH|nr:hypothetical protein [Labrys miyagiensis]GLS19811.1 hypothetical protein GCM10007874_28280 [Labrys miyagiensis]
MDDPALPYTGLTALRAEHLALLREWRASEGRNRDTVSSFRRRVVATGAVLEQEDDRRAVQDILEYWSAQLLASSESEAFPDLDLELAPFAPGASLPEQAAPSPPAPLPPRSSPAPAQQPPSPARASRRRRTRLRRWLFWILVLAACFVMTALWLGSRYRAPLPGSDVGGDKGYDSLQSMIASNGLIVAALFGLVVLAALAFPWRASVSKRALKSAGGPETINPREQIRLSALARQWRESDYLSGYLLTGVALEEASGYRRKDPEIEELVAASEASQRRTLFIQRGFFAVSFLLILLAAAASYLIKETEASRRAAVVAMRARQHAESQTADARIRARKLSDLLNLAVQDQVDSSRRMKDLQAELDRMKALLADARNTLDAVSATPPQADHQKTAVELAATLTQALNRYDSYAPPPAPATLTAGQQLLVSTVLIDSPDETQRDNAVRQLKDGFQGTALPTTDQVRICDTMVGMLMHPSVDGLTQTGLANLLEVLAAVPPGKWARPEWIDARAGARRASAWLLNPPAEPVPPAKAGKEASPVIVKNAVDGGARLTLAAQKLFAELKHNIGLEPPPGQSVFLQFATMSPDEAAAVGKAMTVLGWRVQGTESADSAKGIDEVRYGSPEDAGTAALLVGDLRKYGLSRMKLAPMNLTIKAGTLEIWLDGGTGKDQ